MSKTCNRSPRGWVCYLERGHDDVCPMYPRWWNLPAQIEYWRFLLRSRRGAYAAMTADNDPALDGDRELIRFLRENAEHLGWDVRESPDSEATTAFPERYNDEGRCRRCRHAEHDGFACLNMQSDNDCACPPDSGSDQ